MFLKVQFHYKSTYRPNFGIIPPPFDIKMWQTSHHPHNCPNTRKMNLQIARTNPKFGKLGLRQEKLGWFACRSLLHNRSRVKRLFRSSVMAYSVSAVCGS